jgi:hypothetical protein
MLIDRIVTIRAELRDGWSPHCASAETLSNTPKMAWSDRGMRGEELIVLLAKCVHDIDLSAAAPSRRTIVRACHGATVTAARRPSCMARGRH